MKKTVTVLIVALTVVLLVQAVGLAWMSDNGLSSPIDITSNVHKAYFESGNGSEEAPYVIATPLQLYYFAWLQYLGYFNQDGDDEGTEIDTVYFTLQNDIDMYTTDEDGKPLQYVLPPIGTTDNPFVGNFDGAGHTVKNAVIENYYSSLIDPPNETTSENFKGVEIIGFFGVVGSLPEDTYTYDSQANEVKNLVLENLTVKTQTEQSLIGLVAGYVNGVVDCVGVAGGTVNIKDGVTALSYTANISDYSLIGYCAEAYRDSVYVMDVVLSNPGITDKYTVVPEVGGDGETQGWGGSIAMNDMFTFVQSMMNDASINTNYIYDKTYVINPDGTKTLIDSTNTEKKVIYDQNLGASFVFSPRREYNSNTYSTQYTYLSGGARVTNHTYLYTDKDVTVYYITDGTNYLCYNGAAITNTTNQANATKWYVSNGANGGSISTVVDGTLYYLTIANNNVTVTGAGLPDNAPSWLMVNNDLRLDSQRIEFSNGAWRIAIPNTFLIASGSHYLSATLANNGTVSIADSNNADSATRWSMNLSGTSTTISTVINGTTYYLGRNNNNLTITTNATNWTYDATNVRLSNGNRYLRYSNGWSTGSRATSTGTNLTLTGIWDENEIVPKTIVQSSQTTAKEIAYTLTYGMENEITQSGNSIQTGVTYYPITVESSGNTYTTATGNTGYVISSSQSTTTSQTFPYGSGDIRVSRYTTNSSIPNYRTPNTITYKTNGAYKTINNSTDATTYGLEKFNDCFDSYTSSVGTNCYGLHFMEATINIANVITAERVQIIGETYTDYQLPTNCIDFNLAEQGFINFVAGTYFTNNNSFFSLHKIERSQDKKTITAIKEIKYIYGYVDGNGNLDVNKPYYYTYSDGSEDAGRPANYSIVFRSEWITSPTSLSNNTAYYFEVPVYAGEYALGSAGDDKIGAYLVYLDLAANAQLIERHKEYEKIEENNTAATIPNGVELLAPGETYDKVDPSDSVFVSINTSNVTTKDTDGVTFETEDGVTIKHSATSGTSAEYIGNNNVLLDGNGSSMSLQGVVTTIERTTYRDYNINTSETTVTVITKTTANGEVTYTRTITVTDADGNVTKEETTESSEELFPETKDTDTSPTLDVNNQADLVNLYFSYGQEVALTVTYLYVPAVTDDSGNVTAGAEYQITVTNPGAETVVVKAVLTEAAVNSGITVVINGQALAANTNAQTVEIATTGGAVEEPAA